jgi:hypothetical protein
MVAPNCSSNFLFSYLLSWQFHISEHLSHACLHSKCDTIQWTIHLVLPSHLMTQLFCRLFLMCITADQILCFASNIQNISANRVIRIHLSNSSSCNPLMNKASTDFHIIIFINKKWLDHAKPSIYAHSTSCTNYNNMK